MSFRQWQSANSFSLGHVSFSQQSDHDVASTTKCRFKFRKFGLFVKKVVARTTSLVALTGCCRFINVVFLVKGIGLLDSMGVLKQAAGGTIMTPRTDSVAVFAHCPLPSNLKSFPEHAFHFLHYTIRIMATSGLKVHSVALDHDERQSMHASHSN